MNDFYQSLFKLSQQKKLLYSKFDQVHYKGITMQKYIEF